MLHYASYTTLHSTSLHYTQSHYTRLHYSYNYHYNYNIPLHFFFRIGTPRCCIKQFFNTGSPVNFSCPVCLVLVGSNFISSLRVPTLYIFWVPKFSGLGLQFYMRLRFYRDICPFCMVSFSRHFFSVSMHDFMKQLGHQRIRIL